MSKFLCGVFLSVFFALEGSQTSLIETSSLETSSDDMCNPDFLETRAITIINIDLKRRIYNYIQRKAREDVKKVVTTCSKSIAYHIAKNFFYNMQKYPTDTELLVLSEYIREIPDFYISMEMLLQKYSFMQKVQSKNKYGILSHSYEYLICSYAKAQKRLHIKMDGIDNCLLLTLVDMYHVIDGYIKRCGINNVEELYFLIQLSKFNKLNDLLIERLRTIEEKKSIVFSAHDDEEYFHIPHSISRLKQIKELFFSNNKKIHVGKGVSKIKKIESLIIEYDKSIVFSDKFTQMNSLESFILKKTDKTNTDSSYIPQSIFYNMPNLTHLRLEDSFENMSQLLSVIASLSSLRRLYVESYYYQELPELLEKKLITKDGRSITLDFLDFEEKDDYKIKKSKSLNAIQLAGQY